MNRYQSEREEICRVCHLLYERGYVVSNDGNVSMRVAENQVLITPSGASKGRITEDMLVLCDLDGNILDGDRYASSESAMHFMIMKERADVNSVVHAHPPMSTAFAVCHKSLDKPYLTEMISGLGEVPVTEFAMPSTEQVPNSVRPFVHDHNAVLLANHGSIAWGENIWKAFDRLETVEQTAKIFYYVDQMGGGVEFSQQQREELLNLTGFYKKMAGKRK